MKNDIIYSDDGDRLTYFSKSQPGLSVTVARGPIVEAAFLARDWHGGQFTGLYALQCGSFDYETVQRAASEYRAILRTEHNEDDHEALDDAEKALSAVQHPEFGED